MANPSNAAVCAEDTYRFLPMINCGQVLAFFQCQARRAGWHQFAKKIAQPVFRLKSHQFANRLPLAESLDCWDAMNAILQSKVWVGFHIQSRQAKAALRLTRQAF
jgi:hypothetical protein